MITKLKPNIHNISVRTMGIKLYDMPNDRVSRQIVEDITYCFEEVAEIYCASDIEDVADYRTPRACAIFNIDVLIKVKKNTKPEVLRIIEQYINDNFIKTL